MSEKEIRNIPWIDYFALSDFYTIDETCALFHMNKDALHFESNYHSVRPSKKGDCYGFTRHDIRRLHNFIYAKDQALIVEKDAWR